MQTQLKAFNEILLSQLNAFCVKLELDYSVREVFGEEKNLGFDSLNINNNLFESLPPEVANATKQCIQSNLKTNQLEQLEVYFRDDQSVKYKIKIISSIVAADQMEESYFLVTFLLLESKEENNTENFTLESLQAARRKLEFSENRYTSFFENDPVMHFSVNPATGLIADCNKFAVRRLGLNDKSEVIGNPVYTIFTEEKYERCLYLLEKFKNQGYLDSEEMELKTKTGGSIPVILYTTAQRDENGKILFSRSTLVDISELKNAQKRLNQKTKRLEQMNQELEQFVSTCSHDLQEPLATIKFANDLIGKLYKDKLGQKGRSYVTYVDEAVDRLTKQIRSLLSHIRIGQNSERTEVNTEELVDTVLKDLMKSIAKAKAEIIVDRPLPTIKAYKVELRLLFQNLISNAIKYSKPGVTPIIKITSSTEKEYDVFSITDNGIGIDKMHQKEIFRIFNRVNEENPNKGDGVGLAHCDKIIRMHEGFITVNSISGEGSTFVFKLKKDAFI